MNFTHENTFLRSALVRDPFSLGDLGPEDVLRIESQFPNLFDTTSNQTVDETKPKITNSKVPTHITKSATMVTSKSLHKCCDCKSKPSAAAGVKKTVTQTGWRPPLQATSKLSSNVQPPPKPVVDGTRRSGQLLPVSDLKRVLEELLWQRDLKLHQQESSKVEPPKFHQRGLSDLKNTPRSSEMTRKSISKGSKEKLSEKIVSQTLGKISRSNPILQDIRKSIKSRSLNPLQKHELVQKALSNLKRQPTARNKNHPRSSHRMSTPGFIRPTILKSTHSPVRPSSKGKKSVQFSKDIKPQTESTQHRDKPKPNANLLTTKIESTESSSKSIDVKGQGKSDSIESEDIKCKSPDDNVASSYHQLKLASNLATKYEKIGLLTKLKFKQDLNAVEKPKESVILAPRKQIVEEKLAPVRSFNPLTKPAPTSNVLEKLAKELVYVEVLKHLHELQLREKTEIGINQHDNDYDGTPLNNIVEPTDGYTFSFESSDEKLTTPELTPSNSIKQSEKVKSISNAHSCDLPTPDLTPSIRRKINTPANNNDNTDCSEISDFIFSEKEVNPTPKSMKPSPNRVKSESIIMTPQLSSTISNDYAYKSRKSEVKEKIIGTFDSPDTLNLASDFDYSSPAVMKKPITPALSPSTKLSKYLSSVSEELSTAKSKFENENGIKKSISESSKLEVGISEFSQSRKSEIIKSEMLSEGEFIGNVYKSPGEVSIRSEAFLPLLLTNETGSCTDSTLVSDVFELDKVVPDVSTGEYL